MEEMITNPKRMIWTRIKDRINTNDLDGQTFDDIKEIFDEIASRYPLNKLMLETNYGDEDSWEFCILKEALETDEEYQKRLTQEENIRVSKENSKKLAEIKEYNDYLKLKEKFEK